MSNYVHPSEIPDDIRRELEQKRREKLGREEAGTLIYVGNLPSQVTDADIREVFTEYGYVEFVKKNGGYAYVYMTNLNEAQQAVSLLNQAEWIGCTLIVRKEVLQ